MITDSKRIVVKVGTSTLTYSNGKLNLRHMASLCRVLSDLQNSGKQVILVTSGAIGVGMGKLGIKKRPTETTRKQALAAVGQCELMFMYDKIFGEYNHTVAQVLMTRDVVDNSVSCANVINTFTRLLDIGVIPIVNENDVVATAEIEGTRYGDNDTLSAIVAKLIAADALVILTDIDGLYTDNPNKNPDAERIPVVKTIDDSILALAGDAGSELGTGGMITKIHAAQITTDAGIPCAIIHGNDPNNLYRLFDGEDIGTQFLPN